MKYSYIFYILIFSLFISCSSKEDKLQQFTLLSKEETGIEFNNELKESDSLNIMTFDYMYNGGGVAVGDFNNDGLVDIYFTGNDVSGRLYINKGNLKFEDITEAAGLKTSQWCEGVTLVDINNDEFLDIYISTSSNYSNSLSKNMLFVNEGVQENGLPKFKEMAADYGIDDSGYNTQAVFFDYNKDGFLDLFVLSNAVESFNRNTPRIKELAGKGKSTDKLYKNNGNGTFTNVSVEAGIQVEGYGLGIGVSDFNKDGWPDIYIANDFITNDILYINNGDGTFTDRLNEMTKHQSLYGMGVDIADYNNDGFSDIVVVDMMPDSNLRQKSMFGSINYDRFMLELSMGYSPQYIRNTLQLNNGNGSFSEVGQLAGVYKTDWSWAPLFADFDNDGFKDLFISNGYGKDITDLDYIVYRISLNTFGTPEIKKQKLKEEFKKLIDVKRPNFVYKNNGDLTFTDLSKDWGIVQPSLSNGVAFADLDNDGDLDLVVNNINDAAFIYKNNADEIAAKNKINNNYLKLKLKGDTLNRLGIGSSIDIFYKVDGKSEKQYYEHFTTRGYKSSVDHVIHFGLGKANIVDSIVVNWPDGKREILADVGVNKTLHIDYENSKLVPKKEQKQEAQQIFTEVAQSKGINYKHTVDDFIDFNYQRLLPHKHSENGPGIAVGDVNGDGLEDFYIGGGSGNPGKIYIQHHDGTFSGEEVSGNNTDMGALFFDADNDGDLDLYVVSGGSRYHDKSEGYLDRLYFNDGRGVFKLMPDAIPAMFTSGSVVTAADFDKDGDLDLFIGGRIVPGKYPLPAKSYILKNNGGSFTDATIEICPEMQELGMVTAAIWSDYDQDGSVDLVLAGEWMPITFFKNTKSSAGKIKFINTTEQTGLASSTGWWNSIISGDFNNDGYIDYVAGNLGLNTRYRASDEEPVSVYAKDFDNNGTIDPIMFYYVQGENVPAHPRDNLIDQISAMKGRFQSYADYGKTTFDNFFRTGELDGSYQLKSTEFRSSIFINSGNGTFTLKPLPNIAQLSPGYGLATRDFDGDGNSDLLLVGNSYATEVNTGRYDASIGNFLKGDGNGNFQHVDVNKSGFFVDGNAKAMAELIGSNGEVLLLISQNSDSLKVKHFNKDLTNPTRVVSFNADDWKVEIRYKNGSVVRQELYYGTSYLSQSSRKVIINNDVTSLQIYSYSGKKREYKSLVNNLSLSGKTAR